MDHSSESNHPRHAEHTSLLGLRQMESQPPNEDVPDLHGTTKPIFNDVRRVRPSFGGQDMGKLAVLVTIISILATSCTWRDCARTTAYAVGSTAVLFTGNADAYGVHENIGGQTAADLVDGMFDAANTTE